MQNAHRQSRSQGPLARYLEGSRGARSILWFTFPILIATELGLIFSLGPMGQELSAHRRLASVYDSFGVAGLHAPAVLVLVTLLAKVMINRRSGRAETWGTRVRWTLGMVVESVMWAIPLVVLAMLIASSQTLVMQGGAGEVGGVGGAVIEPVSAGVHAWPWHARATVALGAGVYEEFLFRMVLMSLVHALAVDLAGTTTKTGLRLAVGVSAVLFTLSHDLSPGRSGGVDPGLAFFLLVAGVGLAWLYLRRGFGIAVGAHAAYDLLALFPGPWSGGGG